MPPPRELKTSLCGHAPGPADAALVERLRQGFALGDRPFAEAGLRLGMPEDEVIERLRQLIATGVLERFGPVYARAGATARAGRRNAAQMLDAQLVAATRSGLPLVPQPYEALGATLGVSAAEVQARLADLLARGVIRRIGAVTRGRPN